MLAITSSKSILLANLSATLQIQTRINKTIGEQFSLIRVDQQIFLKLVKPS